MCFFFNLITMMVTVILVTMMVTKVLIMMTIITMVLPLNDDDNNDRDVTSDKCGVFFPLLSHHDGTVRPTILRTYGDDDDSIAVPDNNNR